MGLAISKRPKSFGEAEALLTIVESYPESAKADNARDKLLQMAKDWEETGRLQAALSLYKRLIQGQKYAEAVKKYRPMGVAPKPKVTPKELGLSGVFTWPFVIAGNVVRKIRGQADKELEEEKNQ